MPENTVTFVGNIPKNTTFSNSKQLAAMLFDPVIRSFLLPILSLLLTLLLKVSSRKDKELKITRTDVAIGSNLIVAASVVLLNLMFRFIDTKSALPSEIKTDHLQGMVQVSVLLLGNIVIGMLLSLFVRWYGWEKNGKKIELNWTFGVILPNLVGATLLINAANYSITTP